ncbi:MAG: hypothetical protein HY238_05365 [Acidobacteria bacterium]|nr:hypothetical protein [Acidobacteriota bacterium]
MRLRVLLAFLAATTLAPGATEFETGQAARLVVGQPSFTSERPVSSQQFLGAAGGVAVAGDRLFVVDSSRIGAGPVNHRVLIYNNRQSFVPAPVAELPQGSNCPACVGLPDVVLGQPDFDKTPPGLENGFNSPTAVASDGIRLAVADTDNNRVLIWNTIPFVNGTPPDVVVGQPDFKTNLPKTEQGGLRGPQGVWFHNGKLIIADTQNSRILIYNSVPASNGARADVVVGEPDFNTRPSPDLTRSNIKPAANNMLSPVTATTSGNKLIVADLGFNRVLVFNSVPASNGAAADLVIGQPDMTSDIANNSSKDSPLCPPSYKDDQGNDVYPARCLATLSFPRFALSDGTRLFIADGGNDRVLVYNTFPTSNGATADVALGQPDPGQINESPGAGGLRAPSALAHDGLNLYVADPFSRRISVFTPAERMITVNGIVNAASFGVYAQDVVTLDGDVKVGDDLKLTIKGKDFEYKAVDGDTLETFRDALAAQINDGENGSPWVYARAAHGEGAYAAGWVAFGGEIQEGDVVTIRIQDRIYTHRVEADDTPAGQVYHFMSLIQDQARDPDVFVDKDPGDESKLRVTARRVGPSGNDISYEATVSDGAKITAAAADAYLTGGKYKENLLLVARTAGADGDNIDITTTLSSGAGITVTTSNPTLTGGNDATEAPPGTQIAIFGTDLATSSATADLSQSELPRELAGAQVYINGIRAPLYSVTPTQINVQAPFEIEGESMSVYVRTAKGDGQVVASVARPVPVTRASPGLYAYAGPEPRAGVVVHGMSFSRGTVAIDSSSGGTADQAVPADIVVRITINDRNYDYTTVGGDTTDSIRDKMVDLINADPGDPDVEASAGRAGFLSARTRVTLDGKIHEGDIVTIAINGRNYRYTVKAADNLTTVANRLIAAINAGPGDPDVTARLSADVGVTAIDVIARKLGSEGNSIGFSVTVSANAQITVTSDAKDNKLGGGSTPAEVILTARRPGKQGDDVRYQAFVPGGAAITATAQTSNLCCGNDYFAPVTPENPAVPGELIVVFGTGLGLTNPSFGGDEGLVTGKKAPQDPPFLVSANPDDFVSSLAGAKTASVDFVGLMPGQVGIYQVNLILNSDLPDDPMTRLTIAQGLFVSNVITFPVRNRTPRRTTQ